MFVTEKRTVGVTLGATDWLQGSFYGEDILAHNQSGWAYTVGTGTRIGSSIAFGYGAFASTATTSTFVATGALRTGLQGLNIAQDLYGVGQSAYNVINAQESWSDALSFAAPIGALAGVARNGRAFMTGSREMATGGIHRLGKAGFADIDNTGVAVRSFSSDRIRITGNGIDVVEQHLSRFTRPDGKQFGSNIAMLTDLRRIANGSLDATKVHRDFYAHELREFVRFRAKGFETGMPHSSVYRNAHYATLSEYGIPFNDHADYLYTPFAQSMLFR